MAVVVMILFVSTIKLFRIPLQIAKLNRLSAYTIFIKLDEYNI